MSSESLRIPLAFLATSLCSGAAVIHYQETFPNGTGGNVSHASTGWSTHYGATAIESSTNTNNGSGGGFVVSNLGSGYGAAANANPAGLAYTTEFAPLNRSLTEITSFSFYAKNADASDIFRVVIGLDAGGGLIQWYASQTTFSTAAGTWGTQELKELAFSTAASSWRELTFTPGSTLSLAGSTLGSSLPTGNLVAAGLYVSGASDGNHAGTMRYDDFTINVVPEPSAAALGLASTVLLLKRRRKF